MQLLFTAFCVVSGLAFPRTTGAGPTEDSTRERAILAPASSFADFDGDGLVDVYSVDPGGVDHLYRNSGDGEYLDVTEPSGLGGLRGTRMALPQDFNGDGHVDLYVCAISGRSRLFQNHGGGSFEDVTESAGIAHADDQELYAEWIDLDGDELSDLHVVTSLGDRLFRNAGRGRFAELDLSTPSGSAALRTLIGASGLAKDVPAGSAQNGSGDCAEGVVDQAGLGSCIGASRTPTLGKLMPLSRYLSISGPNVGIRTPHPVAPLDIALGDKSFQIRRDGNLVPGINLTGTGGNLGILRLRNVLEIWPNDAGTAPGRLVLFPTIGAARCEIDAGGGGNARFRLGDNFLEFRDEGNVAPAINMTGTGASPGTLRMRRALEIWPDDAQTSAGVLDVRGLDGAPSCALWGDSGDAWFLGKVGIGTSSPQSGLSLTVATGLKIDYLDQNNGVDLWNALNFGGPVSGEAIGSKRNAGGNQYGLDFYTGYAPRLQVTNDGLVGIGRLPTANKLEIEGEASKTTAGDWLANSDRRIKKDIRGIDGALATLDRIRPVAFRYSDEYVERHPTIEDKEYYNVVAQEFAEVFPDYVQDSGEDGILQVDTHPALIHAIAAVQELHGIVQEKEREIATLEERLARLESSIATLSAAIERQR